MLNQKKPPKEGTKSEKLIHEENVRTLRFYRYLFLSAYAIYFLVTLIFFWSTYTKRYITLSLGCFGVCLAAYKFMSYMATPSYAINERGTRQLVDAGLDLNIGSGGLGEQAKDAIIMCSLVTILSLIHQYFWFLLLIIPMRLFYVLWVNILSPWIFDPNQEVQVNEKKQKKMERKMRRVGHLMHVTDRGVGRAN
ncbi:Transmembrane protein [Schistosoma japonicum]|uniref:Transmembrane protein 208 n=2 Tax=Schistosoma japonicum TaxID=6182 RepID=C1L467_SCHJA|nr:Transmembrane protein [Schistosoma japonicum]CAX69495.1 Protein of unknown function DUF788,domain-containing protein [Schistosoma japonicum]